MSAAAAFSCDRATSICGHAHIHQLSHQSASAAGELRICDLYEENLEAPVASCNVVILESRALA